MHRLPIFLLALLVGVPLGWILLGGFCSVPGIKFSNACGHNAYLLLVIFVPLGTLAAWYAVSRIRRVVGRRR